MTKTFIFKFLISACLLFLARPAYAGTFASLSPVPTEILYALGAEDKLLGVSSACDYPSDVKNKPIIGDTYFVNMEEIVKLKPDYLLAMSSSKPMLGELSLTKSKPVYFDFSNINDIYSAISALSNLAGKGEAGKALIQDIKSKISKYKTKNPKKILYVVQTQPLITIGGESFITDVIEKSGHKSVSSSIKSAYPTISLEFAFKEKPDVIIICYGAETREMKKLFPNAKFLCLTSTERDLINRPAPRVWQAVRFFAEL